MADLSGTWLGTVRRSLTAEAYWQGGVPNRFEVTLLQSGNTLTGNILDDNYLGEARLSGEVIGRRIQFTKRYLSTSPDPVNYTGTLAESEDFMQGQWRLGRFTSGSRVRPSWWRGSDGRPEGASGFRGFPWLCAELKAVLIRSRVRSQLGLQSLSRSTVPDGSMITFLSVTPG